MTTWLDAVPVFVTIPRCPFCGSRERILIRSMPTETDGSKTKRCVCKRCSRRYLIVSEDSEDSLPIFGDSDF
jgi:transcriptional regulator NrdR family protein